MRRLLAWEHILNPMDSMVNKNRAGMNFPVLFLQEIPTVAENGFVCNLPDIVNTIFFRGKCRNMLKLADCTKSFWKCG